MAVVDTSIKERSRKTDRSLTLVFREEILAAGAKRLIGCFIRARYPVFTEAEVLRFSCGSLHAIITTEQAKTSNSASLTVSVMN